MWYHLIKEQDEVDREGYEQSEEPQVVEIPGQVMLERKGQAGVEEFWKGKRTSFPQTEDLVWLEMQTEQVLFIGNPGLMMYLGRNQGH